LTVQALIGATAEAIQEGKLLLLLSSGQVEQQVVDAVGARRIERVL
jgi:hypothetical protein